FRSTRDVMLIGGGFTAGSGETIVDRDLYVSGNSFNFGQGRLVFSGSSGSRVWTNGQEFFDVESRKAFSNLNLLDDLIVKRDFYINKTGGSSGMPSYDTAVRIHRDLHIGYSFAPIYALISFEG